MRRATRTPVIAVWGHFHGGNLGDDLVVATVIDAARRRCPGAEVIGISLDPSDTRSRHGIRAYPINPGLSPVHPPGSEPEPGAERLREIARRIPALRRVRALQWSVQRALVQALREAPFLWRSQRLLHGVDLIVVAGSGVFTDGSGAWRHPYTTFRWALLARLSRVPLVFPSVGAGPLSSSLSSLFIRHAIAAAGRLSVRDRESARVLAASGIPGPFTIVPDMAFALPESIQSAALPSRPVDGRSVVVGLNVMAHQDPRYTRHGDEPRYEAYVSTMASFTEWLLGLGYTVHLFSSQTPADRYVADDLWRVLAARGPVDPERLRNVFDEIIEVSDLIRVITSCDLIVAARFHSVLLSLVFDVPALGIAYNQKTSELLAEAGHPDHCLDIDALTGPELAEMFRRVSVAETPAIRLAQRARLAEYRAKVEQQFDAIFATQPAPPEAAGAPAPEPLEPGRTGSSDATLAVPGSSGLPERM